MQIMLPTGLIIDAFGELRDQLESVKEDMESNCFICGIGKDYFDKVPHGFDTHVAQEHNLANYMYVKIKYFVKKYIIYFPINQVLLDALDQ
jgi:hypothetical protein